MELDDFSERRGLDNTRTAVRGSRRGSPGLDLADSLFEGVLVTD
jgi:hypothetical protein